MIAKAKACVGGSVLIGYVVNEKKGYELERNNLSGENATELFESMQIIQNQNLRCQNNTISLVLSPEKDEGNKLTNEQWKQLGKGLLKSLGVDTNEAQYISFIHTEKEHKHVHILNRVQDDGSLIKDHFIGKRAQHIAHRLAKEMNLKSAMEIKKEKELTRKELLKDFRYSYKMSHKTITEKFPKDITEYSNFMKHQGFTIIPSINKQGEVQGYKVQNTHGDTLKLSEIERKIKLDDTFFKTLEKEKVNQSITQNIVSQKNTSYKFRR